MNTFPGLKQVREPDVSGRCVIDSCLATTGACLNVRRLAQLLHAAMADPKGRFASMRHAKALKRLTLVQLLIALTRTGGARNHE